MELKKILVVKKTFMAMAIIPLGQFTYGDNNLDGRGSELYDNQAIFL